MLLLPLKILPFAALLFASTLTGHFQTQALKKGVNPVVLEGICRYESDSGRAKVHKNRNASWDVGYCMNHRRPSVKQPRVPGNFASVTEASKELKYWHRQHERFCVHTYEETGTCGKMRKGRLIGIKNCQKPHPWWGHYNWGFRVLSNGYDKRVQCFMDNGFKKCNKKAWQQVKF